MCAVSAGIIYDSDFRHHGLYCQIYCFVLILVAAVLFSLFFFGPDDINVFIKN